MTSVVSSNPANYRPLGGRSRRYRDLTTGQTISRRRYDQLFRLPTQGYRSYEHKAANRAAPQAPTLDRFYRVVRRLRYGESLTTATRAEHVSPSTIERLNAERGIIVKRYQKGKAGTKDVFAGYVVQYAGRATFWTRDGLLHQDVPLDWKNLRLVAQYENTVKKALERGIEHELLAFANAPVYDLYGNTHYLVTDLNELYALHEAQMTEGTDWDALFKSEEGVLYAP